MFDSFQAIIKPIHDDAKQGILVGNVLDNYIKNNQIIINEQSSDSGSTPLAIAVIEGFTDEVDELLEEGVMADSLSRDKETLFSSLHRKPKENELDSSSYFLKRFLQTLLIRPVTWRV